MNREFFCCASILGSGKCSRCGVVRIRALDIAEFLAWPQHGLLEAGLLVSGFGSVGTAINILTTVLCMRTPGMTLGRMPLFAWLNLVMAGLLILAIGPLTAAQFMLLVDRYLGGHFFDTMAGGSAVLWMHSFWIFGQPEVYVLVLPAFAIASEIIPVFSRKVVFG